MSEFDREAERERLREKYEAEEADRASARHMGELLLRGARMTDRHCPECGSPLFEEDGTTFCPECEREVVESDAAESAAAATTESGSEGAETPRTPPAPPAAEGDVRSNLETALERAAGAAARTDDPRRAREHLEAVRAAIEALAALRDHSGS